MAKEYTLLVLLHIIIILQVCMCNHLFSVCSRLVNITRYKYILRMVCRKCTYQNYIQIICYVEGLWTPFIQCFILLLSVNLMIKVILYWLSMIEYCVLHTSIFIFILYGGKAVRYQICPVHHSSIVTECCLRLNVVLKYFWAKLLMRLLKCPSKPTQDTSSIFTQC